MKSKKDLGKLFKEPRKIQLAAKHGGSCELCGKELGTVYWIEGENTGCTKTHVRELQRLELADLEQDGGL